MIWRNLIVCVLLSLSGAVLYSTTSVAARAISLPESFTGTGPGPVSVESLSSSLRSPARPNFLRNTSRVQTLQNSGSVNGYVRVQPGAGTAAPSGFALLSLRSGSVLVTETSVPASPVIRSGRVFVEAGGAVSTGIAITNPGATNAVISFHFRDSAGNSFRQGSFILEANHQQAGLLTEAPFNGRGSMLGSFVFSASQPVAVAAFRGVTNERGEFLATTLPVWSGDQATDSTLFPELAEGDGWDTELILSNHGNSTVSGEVEFYSQGRQSQAGSPLRVRVNGDTGVDHAYTIPAGGMFRMSVGAIGDAISGGSARIVPFRNSTAPVGLAILSYRSRGVTVSQTAVAASGGRRAFRAYVESLGIRGRTGSIQTRLAIANPSGSSAVLNLELTTLDGKSFGRSTTLNVPANGQTIRYIGDVFDNLPDGFRGILHVTSSSPVAMNALRGTYNERRDFLFTTTSPSNLDAPAIDSEMIIPQVVVGGGYNTRLTLFTVTPGAASGKLLFKTKDGATLPPDAFRQSP